MLIRERFIEMEGSIQKVLDQNVEKKVDLMKEFFNVSDSDRSQENHLGTGEMGLMTEWNGQVAYDDFAKGHENNYRHVKYSTGIQIEEGMIRFKEYNKIKTRVNKKSNAIIKTLNWHASRLFENAFSSYLSADGLSLCNASHTVVPNADTQSNTGTADMTIDAINTAQTAMQEFKDDRGHPMMYEGTLIVCGTYWMKEAKQIAGSQLEPYTSNNQKNIYTELEYFSTPWITGKKWFLVDKDTMKDGGHANWYKSGDPRKWSYVDDFDTEVGKYKSTGWWSNSVDSPFFVYGNNPT